MTGPSTSESFEAGLLALGVQIGSSREQRNPRMAARVLAVATKADPMLADAWLARLAAGETSLAVYEGLWRSRSRLGQALTRYRLTPQDLAVTVELPLLLRAGVGSADAAEAAYVTALLAARRFDDAEAVLLAPDSSPGALSRFCAGCLYYQGGLWPQVIDSVASLRADAAEPTVAAAARVLTLVAYTYLGLFTSAIDLGGQAVPGDGRRPSDVLPQATGLIAYHLGACYRALSQEETAVEFFRTAITSNPQDAAAQEMLANPALQLHTTDATRIAARTDRWDPATESAADDAAEAAEREQRATDLRLAMVELDQHIGLDRVKREVQKLQASIEINAAREADGLPVTTRARHLVMAGPPGTGKTTIARVVARIYCGLGILKTQKVREVRRTDLVAEHIGGTEAKTNAAIDSAIDGVLFIDEAYQLVNTNAKNDFGLVAVDTLLARMENDRDRLVVIVAGYSDDMDRFLSANEGLSSRFPKRIEFPSYTADQLIEICELMWSRSQHRMDDPARDILRSVCAYMVANTVVPPPAEWEDVAGRAARPARPMIDVVGNGRFIRNVIEQVTEEQEFRLHQERAAGGRPDLSMVTAEDMRQGLVSVLDHAQGLDAVMSLPALQEP